jgi:hypothetical protein
VTLCRPSIDNERRGRGEERRPPLVKEKREIIERERREREKEGKRKKEKKRKQINELSIF